MPLYNSVYIEAQSGFRSKMGTIHSMFVLDNVINWLINNKNKFYYAFLDYSKAFDYVVRDIMWYKLLKLGFWVKCSILYRVFIQLSNLK